MKFERFLEIFKGLGEPLTREEGRLLANEITELQSSIIRAANAAQGIIYERKDFIVWEDNDRAPKSKIEPPLARTSK